MILSEVAGIVRYQDLQDALEDRADEATGVIGKTVREVRDSKVQPALVVVDEKGKAKRVSDTRDARYLIPSGATIQQEDGATVGVGDILAKIPREQAKTKDITGGLPTVSFLSVLTSRASVA